MLADSTRVQLLWVLADHELSVNDLAARVAKPAPSVSQHLAKLRMARLVRTRREGTQVFYRLENDHVRQLVTVKISLVVLGITAVAQLAVVAWSGSVALFADTVHNFSDALTAVPLWIAFSISRRAATRRYTYGFGRVEDLAGLFVVAVIAISAVVAAVQAVRRLVDPVPLEHLGWVAAAGVVGFVGNEVVALYRIRVGHRIGSAALRADGMHARADGLTSLAVVAGALGAALGGRRSARRSADRGGDLCGPRLRGPRRVRQAHGPHRPRIGRHRYHGLG